MDLSEAPLLANIKAEKLVDTKVVKSHACADDLRTAFELNLKGSPQDAPSPDEYSESTSNV